MVIQAILGLVGLSDLVSQAFNLPALVHDAGALPSSGDVKYGIESLVRSELSGQEARGAPVFLDGTIPISSCRDVDSVGNNM